MKTLSVKQINMTTLIFLYAAIAVVLCLLLNKYLNESRIIADKTLLNTFLRATILTLVFLVIRCITASKTALTKLENIITVTLAFSFALAFIIIALPIFGGDADRYELYTKLFLLPKIIRYPFLHPAFLLTLTMGALIYIGKIVCFKRAMFINAATIWLYTAIIIVTQIIFYVRDFLATSNPFSLIICLPLIIIPLLSLSLLAYNIWKNTPENMENIAKIQQLIGVVAMFLFIFTTFSLFCLVPLIKGFQDDNTFAFISGSFLALTAVPYIMYRVVNRALFIQLKATSERNFSEKAWIIAILYVLPAAILFVTYLVTILIAINDHELVFLKLLPAISATILGALWFVAVNYKKKEKLKEMGDENG